MNYGSYQHIFMSNLDNTSQGFSDKSSNLATPSSSSSTASCGHKLKVLADDTRLKILQQLLKGPRKVSELQGLEDLEQSLVSHHLKVLRKAGLVNSHREGKAVVYQMVPGTYCPDQQDKGVDLGCCQFSFN